jgi:thiamine biosynthesis lipoprotein
MSPAPFRYSRHAMATTFEIILSQDDVDEAYAAQSANAAFEEIARLEDELSRYRAGSDIYRIGQLEAGESLRLGMAAWDCLSLAKAVHAETKGAFDITIGPLMELFVTHTGEPRHVNTSVLEEARQIIGSHRFELDEAEMTVTVHASRMIFDLGALGKGYALDQAADVLAMHGVYNAVLNAGDSTVLAIGKPPDKEAWNLTLSHGKRQLQLRDRAVSGSGFAVQGAHIMNPRLFQPVPIQKRRTYALAPTAALSDALSTAFMVMETHEISSLCERLGQVEALEIIEE